MHETAIAQDIITIVEETLKNHPESTLKTVRVSIGEMVAIVPDLLQHAYESLIDDTRLAGSRLDIDIIEISAVCMSCKKAIGLKEFEFLCPFCQSSEIEIKTGNEFYVKELCVE